MANEMDKFVDETVIKWIKENDEYLKTLYEAYLEDANESKCTFDEFAVYVFYENNH